MIVSVSRRTDIPAFYSDWFFARLKAGYALVRNPMNPRQVSRVALDRQSADAFVFWSKNPAPMLPRLALLDGIPFYFQFTLTPYAADIESGLPPKRVLLDTFARLSDAVGPERVIWRYDPVLFTPAYDAAFHLRAFEAMARRLAPYTRRVTVSFLDDYPHIRTAMRALDAHAPDANAQSALLSGFAACAHPLGLQVDTCCEAGDFSSLGVTHAHCIDAALLSRIASLPVALPAGARLRPGCGCCASVDIGAYGTCLHGCRYCYAARPGRAAAHCDAQSPLLGSALSSGDVVRTRAMPPTFVYQTALWTDSSLKGT